MSVYGVHGLNPVLSHGKMLPHMGSWSSREGAILAISTHTSGFVKQVSDIVDSFLPTPIEIYRWGYATNLQPWTISDSTNRADLDEYRSHPVLDVLNSEDVEGFITETQADAVEFIEFLLRAPVERLFILETATSIEKLTTLIEARLTIGFLDSVILELEKVVTPSSLVYAELAIRQLEEEIGNE